MPTATAAAENAAAEKQEKRQATIDKRTNFFPGMKRKLTLDDWSPKHNGESEKRVLINFEMPISGGAVTGIPVYLTEPLKDLERSTELDKISLNTEIENMSLDIYDTPDSREECQTVHSATLRKFEMVRRDDIVVLCFNTTVVRTMKLLKFLHDYEAKTVFVEFSPTQAEIGKDAQQMTLKAS